MESYSVHAFAITPTVLLLCACLAGMLVGSFLNVVIVRLPRMIDRAWQAECAEYLGMSATPDLPATRTMGPTTSLAPPHAATNPAQELHASRFNLAVPRSHCPTCQHPLGWAELIPILSWIWLRARCRHCDTRISAMYPLVEGATAILFMAAAWRFGPTPTAVSSMILLAALVALSAIDLRTLLLPDAITQPLLWAGFIVNLTGFGFARLDDAVIGAISGYLVLWLIGTGYRLLRRQVGMGHGDFKLLAALGAWLGWQALPAVILVAALAGAAVALVLVALKRLAHDDPIPFGGFLALGGAIAVLCPGFLPAIPW